MGVTEVEVQKYSRGSDVDVIEGVIEGVGGFAEAEAQYYEQLDPGAGADSGQKGRRGEGGLYDGEEEKEKEEDQRVGMGTDNGKDECSLSLRSCWTCSCAILLYGIEWGPALGRYPRLSLHMINLF